ncbi:hypothetical protein RI129_008109 [Pyrocoelia pectoralis]|uniref:Uncharacterized protein n=1 Tax=Pyrocoelia pectoralis TaxID=417401 RepID=A0AAN7VHJ8_9COLE
MVLSIEDFMVSFHSLQGITIGERRKNLFLLLRDIDNNSDFNLIQPKTPLEECFKVQILLHFKKVPLLIDVLKSENPILIHRIVKESWFMSAIFDYIGEEDLVEKVFPHISFNAKMKLINKLSFRIKDGERGDRLFYAIQKRYGNYMASRLLPCCSANVIMDCVRTWKVELGSRQLMVIVKKHPDLLEAILEALSYFSTVACKYLLTEKYKNVLVYMLNTNLPVFLKLIDKYELKIRVGWRSTEHLIVTNKTNVINHAPVLYNCLHRKQILKSLGRDFDDFYLKLLPTSVDKMRSKLNYYIDTMDVLTDDVRKLNLLLASFRKVYGSELLQHPDWISVKFLELMTVDEREVWMNTNPKPSHIPQDAWNCLLRIEKSLPLMKDKISQTTDIKERGELAGCLVETCRINKDKDALLDVCKYVVAELKSDNASVLYSFLCTLKSCYKPVEFGDKIWKVINELIRVFMLKKSIPFYYHEWLYAYLEYLIVNNLDATEYITELSRKIHLTCSVYTYMGKDEAKKICLEKYGQLLIDLFNTTDESVRANHHVQYYEMLIDWNRKHPNSQISVPYKSVITILLDLNESCRYWGNIILGKLLCLNIDDTDLESCMKLLESQETLYIDMSVFVHLIKRKPLVVLNYIDCITKSIIKLWYTTVKPFLWMYSRNYTHLEMPKKIIATCLAALTTPDGNMSNKRNCAMALACLMPPGDFLHLIEPYYPVELRMEVDDGNQETYILQQAITASLKHVIPPSFILESVLNFSKGDYLKFIQRALHSVSHSTNEDNLPRLYDSLVDRPVSVRKNVVYLTYKVLDSKAITAMVEQFNVTEKNPSINKFILKASFNYFAKNPNDALWELVRYNLKRVDSNDEEIVDILVQVVKVPPSYLVKYLMCVFEYFENLSIKSKKITQGKMSLLTSVKPSSMKILPAEFFWPIIKKYIFRDKDLSSSVQYFASRFVTYNDGVEVLFDIIKEYILETWYNEESNSKGRKCINEFIVQFCQLFIDDKSASRHALKRFSDFWNDFLKPYQAFDEFAQLQFTLMYVDYVDLNWNCEQIAAAICALCKRLEYDSALIVKFGVMLDSFLPHFLRDDNDLAELKRLNIIINIIQNETITCLLIGITLLPLELYHVHLTKLQYEKIIRRLQNIRDQTVKFALSLYFHKVSSSRPFALHKKKDGDTPFYNYLACYIENFTNKYQQAVF